MNKKIDKNYLGQTLKHFDINGDQIIDIQEWFNFFHAEKDKIWIRAKTLIGSILKDIFPDEEDERFPLLAEAILTNHSDDTDNGKEIDLNKLYNYIIRFIAPQKYREYQETLTDKTHFFLYDGIIEYHEFDIFTDHNNRLLTADIYYLIVSYHISPDIAAQMIERLTNSPHINYNPQDFSFDADSVFHTLAIQKANNFVIDIDALMRYAETCNITNNIDHLFHLFDIHNDCVQKISQTGHVNYEIAYNFLNFYNESYLELGIQSLFNALSLEIDDNHNIINLINLLGYRGNPQKIFREIAGTDNTFTITHVKEFLTDNNVKFSIK